jgi:hypothetical protein
MTITLDCLGKNDKTNSVYIFSIFFKYIYLQLVESTDAQNSRTQRALVLNVGLVGLPALLAPNVLLGYLQPF